MEKIRAYLDEVSALVAALPVEHLDRTVERLLEAYDRGRQLFLLGNGGSAATASHLLADFQKCIYMAGGKTFRAMAVTDSIPLITAWANDTHYDNVFAEQLRPWVQPGDLVIAFSGSGNSPNVLRAVQVARELGAWVLGLAGYEGGKLKDLADECIIVPCDNMQRIEDCHMVLGHLLFWRMMGRIEERQAAAGVQGSGFRVHGDPVLLPRS
jgi:D-sedoheptulose 7-phosphate isomerase